jgi:small-conductance mechanosensitive channel
LFPLIAVLALAIAAAIADAAVGSSWLVRLAQSAGVVALLYAAINRFITHPLINAACRWVGIPVAALAVFGVLNDVTAYLDTVAFAVGNIRVSVLALLKAAIFGGILFWLGRMSTSAGQKVIRGQEVLDIQTRELFAKLFEIAIFFVVFILLLQLLGLDLTALAVFGGALGVGLGFGLQQIASNFISGIIILLERSLRVGDYIEMEDGKAGSLTEISMRSSTLATSDGKEVMVPNEKFITSSFVNWTHSDPSQRYEIPFLVSYDTDLHQVPPLIAKALAKLPFVLSGTKPPACELCGFGDTGARFSALFWVKGFESARGGFLSEAHFAIWDALKESGIEMPNPVQDLRLAGPLPAKRKSARVS